MSSYFFLRLAEITLNDFMSVEYGHIVFSRINHDWNDKEKSWKSNVIGIYGPNGSGKTTIINALQILKDILNTSYLKIKPQLRRQLITSPLEQYIRNEANEAKLTFLFYCCSNEGPIGKSIRYSFSIVNSNPLMIKHELFQVIDEKGKIIDTISSKDITEIQIGSNKCNHNADISLCNDMSTILQFDNLLSPSQENEARTFFHHFSERINDTLLILYDDNTKAMLRNDSTQQSLTPIIPCSEFPYLLDLKNGHILRKSSEKSKEVTIETLYKYINFLSDTLETMVPNTRLSIKQENGHNILYIEKNSVSLPFANESYGIKKLVYLSCYLPLLFQSPAYILVLDELDEGLFEHLLGSILMAVEENATGQIIFTAHNLRPLQSLEHGSIRFALLPSTKKNQYPKNVNHYSEINCLNKRSNLRDIYYKAFNFEDEKKGNY